MKNKYEYNNNKTYEEFIRDFDKAFYENDYSKKIIPMTMEASVVRLSDIIAYIGRDIEDSIKIGVVKREDIPKDITLILGDNNSKIVDTLIKDIIINSIGKPYLTFSDSIFNALLKLMEWNYKYIYTSKEALKNQEIIEKLFYELYGIYLKKVDRLDLKNVNTESERNFYEFIKDNMDKGDIRRIIIDYMAGQTDQYFLNECNENIRKFNIEELYK